MLTTKSVHSSYCKPLISITLHSVISFFCQNAKVCGRCSLRAVGKRGNDICGAKNCRLKARGDEKEGGGLPHSNHVPIRKLNVACEIAFNYFCPSISI